VTHFTSPPFVGVALHGTGEHMRDPQDHMHRVRAA
jgi:hypothetical protein